MNLEIKKPNLFIIGAAKAGTTTLYNLLNQHPQIYFPFVKEPAYFCDDDYYKNGDEWYLKTYFRNARQQDVRGEATSRYLFFSEKVAQRIHKFSQNKPPRFIAIFRDPAQLVYSFYWNSVREGHETLPLKDALNAENERMNQLQSQFQKSGQLLYAYSQIGSFAHQISNYLKIFEKDRFMFLLTDDLLDIPSLAYGLQKFLDLNDNSSFINPQKRNPSALPKNKRIHLWLRNRSSLKDFFKVLIPYQIRYKIKNSAIELNLRKFTPPVLEEEIANSIRSHYKEETEKLQRIIQRDLSKWLPK